MADIEMLQALHGDAFILHCQKGNNKGNLVVDGGPNKNSRNIEGVGCIRCDRFNGANSL